MALQNASYASTELREECGDGRRNRTSLAKKTVAMILVGYSRLLALRVSFQVYYPVSDYIIQFPTLFSVYSFYTIQGG
jgi:hypothetical protein